jgi:hypothetical protein
VSFEATAMIGRQGMYVARPEIGRLIEAFGHPLGEADLDRICPGGRSYAEGFLGFLGAKTVHSVDYSDFEGATFVHDMNRPIPDDLAERYSSVLDGGTLEHVFNFPVSIKNCMEMVRVGGHYLAITPANNFFGHGYYQFSPELYFSILSEENGFQTEGMYAFEDRDNPTWYVVKNPRDVGGRVTLMNSQGVYLVIIARRVARKPIFERTPQQSDYVGRWSGNVAAGVPAPAPASRPLAMRVAKALTPAPLRRLLRAALTRPARPYQGFDPRFFQPFDPIPGRQNQAISQNRRRPETAQAEPRIVARE